MKTIATSKAKYIAINCGPFSQLTGKFIENNNNIDHLGEKIHISLWA